jgi:hypothetical protein
MFHVQRYVIDQFVKELQDAYQQTYNILEPQYGNVIGWAGHLALENIANSNALYHNVEHTIMVTMVGQLILKGKHLTEGGVSPKDWMHFTLALLCHDIGYVRGICRLDNDKGNDRKHYYATGIGEGMVYLSPDYTDAILQPYHVDRSQQFIRERFSRQLSLDIDIETVASYIELTRFPIPTTPYYDVTDSYAGLARAADFIGQLGDPGYLLKMPALFYEFAENGMNEILGYETPGDLRRDYTRFYWDIVSPRIQPALRYLSITQEGKQWLANLYAHVFDVEHSPTAV